MCVSLSDPIKGVDESRQLEDGHGS